LLELALILPFLILLLVATVEAGFALRDYLMVQSANREGVRWAVRTPPGDEYREHFHSPEEVESVFNRILIAAEEGGLRSDDMSIVFTHIYIADENLDGDLEPATFQATWPPGFDYPPGFEGAEVLDLSEDNATKAANINAARQSANYEPLWNELVVIEVFYRHETVWGFDIVGPFGEDWTMYARSSMRMVGTGRPADQ
jgi:hypothetical protein